MHLNERPTYLLRLYVAAARCCRSLLPLVMVLPLSVRHLPKVPVTYIALTATSSNLGD
jgi:hypothetical protein